MADSQPYGDRKANEAKRGLEPESFLETLKERKKQLFCVGIAALVLIGIVLPIVAFAMLDKSPQLWLFLIQVTGFYISIGAASLAAQAAYQSAKTHKESRNVVEQLREQGFLQSQTRGLFEKAFFGHLIKPLRTAADKPTDLYLLLSTPAYGYAVIDQEKFSEFPKALKGVHPKCNGEIIFFSPDAHFHYLVNLFFWALRRPREVDFAICFGENIIEVLEHIIHSGKRYHVWIVRESTVRLFAFEPQDNNSQMKAYLLLVDRFCIPQDQFGKGFVARSLQISTLQAHEFVRGEEEHSYFDRIKACPYTFKTGDHACLTPSRDRKHQNLLISLIWDYVFGRTLQHQFGDFNNCFLHELNLFLMRFRNEVENDRELRERFENLSESQIIDQIIGIVCGYFDYFLKRDRRLISPLQVARLQYATEKLQKLEHKIEPAEKLKCTVDELQRTLQADAFLQTLKMTLDLEWDRLKDEEKIAYCLYSLVTSGFGESTYAHSVRQ